MCSFFALIVIVVVVVVVVIIVVMFLPTHFFNTGCIQVAGTLVPSVRHAFLCNDLNRYSAKSDIGYIRSTI